MFVTIFEVWPNDGRADEYFDLAASLKENLEKIDGFISVERFESRTEPGKYLSLSFWRDQQAMETWYRTLEHKDAQARGRAGVFRDYRIRIGEVIRDYDMAAGRPKVDP